MKKVLHIVSWYPNYWDHLQGLFIQEQYKNFSEVTDSHLIHIEIREAKFIFKYKYIKYSDSEEGYYLLTKIKSTKTIEILTTLLLLWVLLKSKYDHYEIIHFHIAYPLLSYYSWWKRIFKRPILISEHWSAYHFNFYMPWNTEKLQRIKNIFKQNIPLISVSKVLLKDIELFASTKEFHSVVIPNIIDQEVFFYKKKVINKIVTFFAVNHWREIKNPFPMLEGFVLLHDKGIYFKLILGGYGELIEDMKAFVKRKGMIAKVEFIGKMDKKEIATILLKSDGYLISSSYETFSVVSAQALCCGVPIIGAKLLAIKEYADEHSYLSLARNDANEWMIKLLYFINNKTFYTNKYIAFKANNYLDNNRIKKLYQQTLDKWFN